MANGLLGDPTALRGLLQSPSTTDFALAMLANSGYSNRRRSLGEIVGASMLQSRQMAAEAAQQKLREQYMQAQIAAMQQRPEAQRRIVKGPDGLDYYEDGTRVLPNVQAPAASRKPRETREVNDGPLVRTEEFNPETGQWELIAKAPRWSPQAPAAAAESPAAVREYEFFNRLPAEQQKRYLALKRAHQVENIGGVPTIVRAAGDTTPLSTPQAEQDAAFGAAAATAAGTAAGQAEATGDKKAANARGVIDLLADAEALIDRSTAGAIDTAKDAALGRLNISTPGQQAIAELQIIQSSLIQNMPRMEGPQSDKDVELYRQAAGQIANPLLPREVRKTAVRRIITLNQKYANSPTGARRRPNNAPVDILAEAEAELRNGR